MKQNWNFWGGGGAKQKTFHGVGGGDYGYFLELQNGPQVDLRNVFLVVRKYAWEREVKDYQKMNTIKRVSFCFFNNYIICSTLFIVFSQYCSCSKDLAFVMS